MGLQKDKLPDDIVQEIRDQFAEVAKHDDCKLFSLLWILDCNLLKKRAPFPQNFVGANFSSLNC